MSSLWPTVSIHSFDSFRDFASEVLLPDGSFFRSLKGFVFRGVSRSSYKLVPKALRREESAELRESLSPSYFNTRNSEYGQIVAEYQRLREFCRIANKNNLAVPNCCKNLFGYLGPNSLGSPDENEDAYWISDNMIEIAALAQHYGVSTRMLDWTHDINVAIYFACKSLLQGKDLGEETHLSIWALNALHIDTLKGYELSIPIRFVTPPYYRNPNIAAQKGILSYWRTEIPRLTGDPDSLRRRNEQLIDTRPLEKLIVESLGEEGPISLLFKFDIPLAERKLMLEYIERFGYGAAKLFPGYSGVMTEMREAALLRNG